MKTINAPGVVAVDSAEAARHQAVVLASAGGLLTHARLERETRQHAVRIVEQLLLGTSGTALGIIAVAVYAHTKHWAVVIPTLAWAGGLAAAFAIGAVAGLLPAIRAARLSPTDALRTV